MNLFHLTTLALAFTLIAANNCCDDVCGGADNVCVGNCDGNVAQCNCKHECDENFPDKSIQVHCTLSSTLFFYSLSVALLTSFLYVFAPSCICHSALETWATLAGRRPVSVWEEQVAAALVVLLAVCA